MELQLEVNLLLDQGGPLLPNHCDRQNTAELTVSLERFALTEPLSTTVTQSDGILIE